MPSNRPFKKLFCDRKATLQMPPVAFKIWVYHYMLEGPERRSWPSRENICETLDIGDNALTQNRKWLLDNGWLKKVGERDRKGEYSVPIFQVTRGTVTPKAVRGTLVAKRVGRVPEKRATVPTLKAGIEVDSEKQVDTEEVDGEKMTNKQPTRQKGKYKKGEFSHITGKPDKIYGQFVEIWSETVGPGALCKKPFKGMWDWFVDTCEAAEADTLVPAFELWAEENASASEDQPIGAFLSNLTEYTQRLAGPKTVDPHVELVRKRSIERDIAESKIRNANILNYKPPEQAGESIEELIARLERTGNSLEN